MIGELVGPYRIVERLGRGALAEVYRAYHQESARDVALKVLLQAPDRHARERFAREAEALRQLRHPSIIEILSVGEHEGCPYYTMPFVRVISLQDMLFQRVQVDHGRFTQDEVLRVVVDVARALKYAHAKGFVHRDVKPGNILVSPDFRPILCDFGLARHAAAETLTTQGTMVGTPQYMAPEQLQGRRADARSDLYSLALVGYEMAAGKLPLAGGEPLAAAIRRLTEPIPPLASAAPQLAVEVSELIMRMLEADPRKRPASAAEILQVLERVPGAPPPLESEDPDTQVGTPALAPPDDAASAPTRVPAAAVAGLGVLGLSLAVWWGAASRSGDLEARCLVVPAVREASIEVGSDTPIRVSVRYGRPGSLDGMKSLPGAPALSHRIVLDGLAPATEHAFQLLFSLPDGTTHEEPVQRFRTAEGPR